MRAEKNGFVLHLEGTWMEISNKYGVLEYGDVAANQEEVPDGYTEKALDDYISKHSVVEKSSPTCVKRVAFDKESKRYIQLQAVLPDDEKYWQVQKYDNELVYMGTDWTGCQYRDELEKWMCANFDIEACLTAEVFRSSLGDCTNGGISSTRDTLYILSETKGPFKPEDIRECVYIEWREACGEQYIDCKPAYCSGRWYMSGGNFLYTSDSRFREITESMYPIPIHDRYEWR
ncbi:hypothetical protein [Sporofaciens musculi]|uniref:hypothetical protein n=1 Tax=Sporofaciens musculi TaxID=2681861 RepID=UPI002570EE1D|nr:hypothetical protein [Sporofaciens musculi]